MTSEENYSYLYLDRSPRPRGEVSAEVTARQARTAKHEYHRFLEAHARWGGSLSEEEFVLEVEKAAGGFMDNIPFLVRSVNPVVQPMLTLNTDTARRWYRYAFNGVPVWYYEDSDAKAPEIQETGGQPVDLHEDFNIILAYNEYFDAPKSASGANSTFALDVVINKAMARFKLDWFPYTKESGSLSIAEVALLAGMSERSVRNVAFKELGAVPKSESKRGMTYVSSEKAIRWLEGRRKFVPSTILQNNRNIDLMLDFMDTYAC